MSSRDLNNEDHCFCLARTTVRSSSTTKCAIFRNVDEISKTIRLNQALCDAAQDVRCAAWAPRFIGVVGMLEGCITVVRPTSSSLFAQR